MLKISWRRVAFGLALGLVAANSFSADCSCNKHKAGASGSGTCSLTEDSSRCSITYTGQSSSKSAAEASKAARALGIRTPIDETFRQLNEQPPASYSERQLSDLLVNSLLLTGQTSGVERMARQFRLQGNDSRPDFTFQRHIENFQRYGCLDFEFERVRYQVVTPFADSRRC